MSQQADTFQQIGKAARAIPRKPGSKPRKSRAKPKHLHKPTGRPPRSDAELEVLQKSCCAWMMTGKSVKAWCEQEGISTMSVHVWRRESLVFANEYARAREDGADAWADEIVDIADSVATCRDSAMVNAARLRVDARKWAASKLKPRTYGERIETALAIADTDNPVDDARRAHVLAALLTFQAIESTGIAQMLATQAPVAAKVIEHVAPAGKDAQGPPIDKGGTPDFSPLPPR